MRDPHAAQHNWIGIVHTILWRQAWMRNLPTLNLLNYSSNLLKLTDSWLWHIWGSNINHFHASVPFASNNHFKRRFAARKDITAWDQMISSDQFKPCFSNQLEINSSTFLSAHSKINTHQARKNFLWIELCSKVEDRLDGKHCCRELDIWTKLVCLATLSNLTMVARLYRNLKGKTHFLSFRFCNFPPSRRNVKCMVFCREGWLKGVTRQDTSCSWFDHKR